MSFDLRGFIIGTGAWRGAARETAEAASANTGLPFTVIEEDWVGLCHPSWLKLWIPERYPADGWLVMDADIVPLRPWNPMAILERDAGAVHMARDRAGLEIVERECLAMGIPRPDLYCNAGMLLFAEGGRKVLEQAREEYPRGGRWIEQSLVNRHVQTSRVLYPFARCYNHVCSAWQVEADPDAFRFSVNVHVVGLKNNLARLGRVRKLLNQYATIKRRNRNRPQGHPR